MRRLLGVVVAFTAGCGPAPGPPGPVAGVPGAASGPLRFRSVGAELGVAFTAGGGERTPLNIAQLMAGGAGWIDADDDGWPDLVLVGLNGAALFRNEAGKRFRDVTAGSGLERLGPGLQGVAAADADGDGRDDLLVTRREGVALLRNLGAVGAQPRYRDVTREAGLSPGGWCTSAAFADVDGDGDLDLFVGRYLTLRPGMPEFQRDGTALLTLGPYAYPPERGVLYRNLGGGRFRDVTVESGLAVSRGYTLGAAFADYDEDGDADLYLANDQVPGDFFENDGRGRFRSVGVENGTALSGSGARQAGMGADWGDYDRDGRLDLVVTTFFNEPKSLYRQEPGLRFTESSLPAGLGRAALPGTAFGVAFADFNNDGWSDLAVANGHVQDQIDRTDRGTTYLQPTQVLLNEQGRFRDVSAAAGAGLSVRIVGRALAAADFDRDGRQDLAVANLAGAPLLLRNESECGSWLGVRLEGPPPNTRGLGAMLTLTTSGGRQKRVLQTGRSYLATFPPEAHFGLGRDHPEALEVVWPDGRRQRLTGLRENSLNFVRRK